MVAACPRECDRNEQVRYRNAGSHRDDHRDRHHRGDRSVEADHRSQDGGEHEEREEEQRMTLSGASDQPLPGPGRDAGQLEAGADHEQRRDEDHHGDAEPAHRLVPIKDPEVEKRERRPDRDRYRR
jgi:hypothetical protein